MYIKDNALTKEKFIRDYVAAQPQTVQKAVAAYEKYALEESARICNDGFPDSRFKGTYPAKYLKARKFIARVREWYEFNHGGSIRK